MEPHVLTASGGHSVSVSGDTAVVGLNSGADVFVRSGGVWTHQQTLARGGVGYGVSVSGDTVVLGAYSTSGTAYVFKRTGVLWTEDGQITPSDAAAGDWFGCSVSVSGDTTVVGAYRNDNPGADGGSAYAYDISVTDVKDWSLY